MLPGQGIVWPDSCPWLAGSNDIASPSNFWVLPWLDFDVSMSDFSSFTSGRLFSDSEILLQLIRTGYSLLFEYSLFFLYMGIEYIWTINCFSGFFSHMHTSIPARLLVASILRKLCHRNRKQWKGNSLVLRVSKDETRN